MLMARCTPKDKDSGGTCRRTGRALSDAKQPQAFSQSGADGQRRGEGGVVHGLPS